MTKLYPSWIEIPVNDMDRALAFYRAVFELTDTPLYDDEPPALIAVLLPSDKSVHNPGVSLIRSPQHTPSAGGGQINFHIGDYASFNKALEAVKAYGGHIHETVEMEDGVKYAVLADSEGNTIAISAYEESDPK